MWDRFFLYIIFLSQRKMYNSYLQYQTISVTFFMKLKGMDNLDLNRSMTIRKFLFIKEWIYIITLLKSRETDRLRERAPVFRFTPQMLAKVVLGQDEAGSSEFNPGLPYDQPELSYLSLTCSLRTGNRSMSRTQR